MKGHQADKFVTTDTRVLRVYAIEGGRVVTVAQKCDLCGRPVHLNGAGRRWRHGREPGTWFVPRCYVGVSRVSGGIYLPCRNEAVDGRHLCDEHLATFGKDMEPRPWNPADDGIED